MTIEGIIRKFDPEVNFWEEFPNMLIHDEFKKLHGRDRSNNKDRSSREMWGYMFLYDMDRENWMRHGALDQRKLNIAKEVILNEKFDWDKEKDVNAKAQSLCQPDPQRMLFNLKNKIDERLLFVNKTKYTLDEYVETAQGKSVLKKGTADQLDRMMINTGKLFEQWEYWTKEILLDREKKKINNKRKSAGDAGEI